ncbi:hypothetical protein [Staphylococcus epidermidis]|nr:hypothetical protein [Staphylococcus epidermidis]
MDEEECELNFKGIFKDFGVLLRKGRLVIGMLLEGLSYVMLLSYW